MSRGERHKMSEEPAPTFPVEEILASLGIAVIATDVSGVIVYWNDAAERLYGWSRDDVVGRKIEDVTIPDVGLDTATDIMDALRKGVPWSGGLPVRRKDGCLFPALVIDAGIYREGDLVGIVGASTNLGTALRPLLERSTDAALVLRSDAVVAYASPAVGQLFGWETSIVGTSVVPLLHPDERAALAQMMEEVVARPGAHPPIEIRVLSQQGWVWAEAALTNLLDDPDVRGVVCNLRRSLRRKAHETAETQVEQLNAALQSRIVIEQAKGFLAARYDIDPDQAFQRLRGYSRNHHVVIREVARRVVARELDLPA